MMPLGGGPLWGTLTILQALGGRWGWGPNEDGFTEDLMYPLFGFLCFQVRKTLPVINGILYFCLTLVWSWK